MSTLHKESHNKINKLIAASRLNEAFMLLKNRMKNFPHLQIELDRLLSTENKYRSMLDYVSGGHKDPAQSDLINEIKDILYRSNDILLRAQLFTDSSDQYFSFRRLFNHRQISLEPLLNSFSEIYEKDNPNGTESVCPVISIQQATAAIEIFNFIWTLFGENPKDYEILNHLFENRQFDSYLKELAISAIILGNINYFDPDTIEILLNVYENTDNLNLKGRALTGIFLISLLYSDRIRYNLPLRSHLMMVSEDPILKELIKNAFVNIVRTYDTQRIDRKMRNEVIPGLMKINPEIIEKIRKLSSDSENFLTDANPEWEEMMENSDIGNKLQEINDMQLEGADVMVTAFSNLKSFTFFSNIANWFMPYRPGHFEFTSLPIQRDETMSERLKTLMCDSDLHSFLLSMKAMPEERQSQMLYQMQSQLTEAFDNFKTDPADDIKLNNIFKHSLQDLYRFFKFYGKRQEFSDPFSHPFLSSQIEPLIPVLGINQENLRLIAEFYLKNKYYEEASGFFELSESLDHGDFSIWEKIGYCHDRTGKYEEAVKWYKKAEFINPENPWLERKLAVALKNSGNFEEATQYYRKVLEQEPENYHFLMSAGECYLSLGDDENALKHFYHAQYLKPDKLAPIRAIGWVELNSGDFEKALNHYLNILSKENSNNSDILNIAHTYLAKGDFRSALEYYRRFVNNSEKKDITNLLLALREDTPLLKKLNIQTSDLRLIVDKIRYDAED